MILLAISILLFIIAFVLAAIYSFYTRRSKYPLIPNCSLICLAGMIIIMLHLQSTLKPLKNVTLLTFEAKLIVCFSVQTLTCYNTNTSVDISSSFCVCRNDDLHI
jgi:heme/copper-type cytochrome/quinol oxidase subunit 4